MATYYQILGVAQTASAQDIKDAYRRQVRLHHPDLGGKHDIFIEIQRAYEVLSNPLSRATYDLSIAFSGTPPRGFGTRNKYRRSGGTDSYDVRMRGQKPSRSNGHKVYFSADDVIDALWQAKEKYYGCKAEDALAAMADVMERLADGFDR